MTNITANQKYNYDLVFFQRTLHDWVQIVHKNNAIINKWYYQPLQPGAFGYDNLIVSLYYLFTQNQNKLLPTLENNDFLADLVHQGWCENYLFWRDHQPWKTNKNYVKPAKTLGDDRRNLCAISSYDNLPQEEKIKDLDIVNCIRQTLYN